MAKYYTRESPPPRRGLVCSDPSLTKQEFKDDCDLNRLLKRYAGIPPAMAEGAMYGDFSRVTDYLDAVLLVQDAEAKFDALPSAIRDRFRNDPSALLAAVEASATDEKVRGELEELGVLNRRVVVPPVTPAVPAGAPVVVPAGGVVTETVKTS